MRVVDTLLMMIQFTISYLLMLIAMTYNAGLFVAVVVGTGCGHFLFASANANGEITDKRDCCH